MRLALMVFCLSFGYTVTAQTAFSLTPLVEYYSLSSDYDGLNGRSLEMISIAGDLNAYKQLNFHFEGGYSVPLALVDDADKELKYWNVGLGLAFTYSRPSGFRFQYTEYRQFTGTNTNKYVDLSWTIFNQENNEGFEVLASRNGETWEVIGFVRATSAVSYQFRDESPAPGANFYRLRQIDLDGANSLSAILTFEISAGASLVAYPNPASDVLYLT